MASLLGIFEGVLEQMGLGIVVCDARLRILEESGTATAILNRFAPERERSEGVTLPKPLRQTARSLLETEPNGASKQTQRVGTMPGGTLYVSLVEDIRFPEGSHVFVLREGQVREQALLDLVAKRFDINYRERQLVSLVRQGLSNRDIADRLGLSEGTIKNYLHHLFQKLGIRSRSALAPLLEQLLADQSG